MRLGGPCPATPGDFGALEHAATITTKMTSVTSGTVGRLMWLLCAVGLLKVLYAAVRDSETTAAVAPLLHEMRHPWGVTGRKGALSCPGPQVEGLTNDGP